MRTADAIPDQTGRVAIVTGGNTGLGYATAAALAAKGAHVVIAARDRDKAAAAAARMETTSPGATVSVQELDLGSLNSIRAAAAKLSANYPRIDLLVNNAGVMFTPKKTTEDGFELQFGTNHLGHFALTGLLLNNLLPVRGSRVVTVSSTSHRMRAAIHFDDLQWERDYDKIAAYGQAKLANLMFTYELQRRLASARAETIAVAAHPGLSNTDLGRNLPKVQRTIAYVVAPLISQAPELGSLPTLRAATDLEVQGGQYYGPSGFREFKGPPVVVPSSDASYDTDVQQRLWKVSEELTGVDFPVG